MSGKALRVTAALAAVLGCALPASAGRIVAPAGCAGFLTVQMRECGVSHYWRCDEAPEGTLWEVHYDGEGASFLSVYDNEFQWLDSRYFADGSREYLVDEGDDPASLTELLETGEDTYSFVIRESGLDGERDVLHQGYDRLTGSTVTIDGVDLLETEFQSTAIDAETGEEIYSDAGNQYILAEERLFLAGQDLFTADGEETESDQSPMRFIRPGEAGFDDMTPQFGCSDATEIGFTPLPPELLR